MRSNHFLLLYASETGTAKSIAQEIFETAPNFGLVAHLHCVSSINKKFSLHEVTCAVLVIATTGDGEAPATAKKLFRRLNSRVLECNCLSNLKYALLALGDSTYNKYCEFGKKLDNCLLRLSAEKFYETGFTDDVYGIEVAADPWLSDLYPSLRRCLGLEAAELHPVINVPVVNCADQLLRESMSELKDACGITAVDTKEEKKSMKNGINHTSLHNIRSAISRMENCSLKMPNLSESYISTTPLEDSVLTETVVSPNASMVKLAASNVVPAKIALARRLTACDSKVKKTLRLTMRFETENISYEPGDSFGFICSNSPKEVDMLLKRLRADNIADKCCKITSRGKKLPSHVPPFGTLRHIFTSCVDIRSVPKKVLLRILATFAQDDEERCILEFLSSHEGSMFYSEFLRKYSVSILEILKLFKSCYPPVDRILEYLPPLKPRFYSVASSALHSANSFDIIFNVIRMSNENGELNGKKGVCSGWLESLSEEISYESDFERDVSEQFSNITLVEKPQTTVHVYKRQNKSFLLPNDATAPLIMVGPGTGLAPFLGFLHHRELQMHRGSSKAMFGETWLFYGCRHKDKDFLCKNELEKFRSCGVLSHLVVCFSRDEPITTQPRHVQDNIVKYSTALTNAIDSGAFIYVCGDAKHMAQDVRAAFVKAFQQAKNCTEDDACYILKKLEKENRYLVDVWT